MIQATKLDDMTWIKDAYVIARNYTLNSLGVERDLNALLADKDIEKVKSLLQNRDDTVIESLKQYNPAEHKIHHKNDKKRDGRPDYRTEKLPRARQRYINEVELFFLLGSPIIWDNSNADRDNAFGLFKDKLEEIRFDSLFRQAKRIAGAETESAILFHLYRDDNFEPVLKPLILSYSKGYTLRPLFDQYGGMVAFGFGYTLREGTKNIEYFELHTANRIYKAKKSAIAWGIEEFVNPIGKIGVVYIQQPKAWEGVQERCDREESIDSKIADTNNYFADPMAAATADVINTMSDPDKPGKMIQLIGPESKFEYINPPIASELQANEKADLNKSILFDSFTPDFSFEAMKGMGTLSGEAIKRALILGYLKRANLSEIYDVAVDRAKNIILEIMIKVTNISSANELRELKITHEFGEPFSEDISTRWSALGKAVADGVMSIDTAVGMMGVVDDYSEEIEKIKASKIQLETPNN